MPQTIFLVEDEPVTALREQKLLKKEGYRVRIAKTGEEAVESAQTCPDIDLILMDIDLGEGIDGTEAARQILMERDIPVVFLSSHTEPEIVEKTEKITSYGYVVKESGNVVLLTSIKMAFRLFDAKMRELEKEKELRVSREQLAESQRMAKLGSWQIDLETNVITLSPEHQLMIGEEPVEVSMPMDEYAKNYILEEDLPLLAEKLNHARENIDDLDFSDSWEYRLKRVKDCVTLAVTGRFKSRGVIQGASQNVTEHKKIEKRLRESEERYRTLFEKNPAVILIIDYGDGRIIFANTSAEKFYGWSREELMAMNISDINQLSFEEVRKEMDKAWQEKQNVFHFSHRCASGNIREVEVYSVPMIWQEQSVLFSIINDITEKMKAEEALKKAFEEKQALLKELQHRAKNTFSILSNMVYLEAMTHDSSVVREVLENIENRIRSTSELYSLLYESGSPGDTRLDYYLVRIMDSVFSLSDPVEITTDIIPVTVTTRDATHIGLLVTELITNSVKHAFPGNRSGKVSLSLKETKSGHLLEITDNGIGLPQNFDLENTGTMGLQLVKGMVEHLGGTLKYKSSGKGTRWMITLGELDPVQDGI